MPRAVCTILLLLAGAGASCATCPAETRARVLAPDFDRPEGPGLSYFAALACEEPEAEYRCFGEGLKERYGATLALYLIARPDLLEELGPMRKYADRLEVSRVEQRPDGVLVWFSGAGAERVGTLVQAQAFWELRLRDGRRRGAILADPPHEYLLLDRDRLEVVLEDLARSDLRGVDLDQVDHFEVSLEWKIADFLLPEQESPRP